MKLRLTLLTLSVALTRAEGDGPDHDHRRCACEAEKFGFAIDCGDREAMLAGLAVLQDTSNDCKNNCASDICHKNYLIVQTHHDYCLHDEVPEPLEDGIHFFEEGCEDCQIVRKPDPSLSDCPEVSCNGIGDEAYLALLTGGCLDSCNTDTCPTNYRILRAVHDTCPEDTLDQAAESGIHDFEKSCEVHNCNTQLSDADAARQLICDNDTSSAPAETAAWWLYLVVMWTALVAVTYV